VGVDDAVEEMTANEAKVPVDGSKSALDKSPVFGLKVVNVRVVVVQICDGNCVNRGDDRSANERTRKRRKKKELTQPMVDPKVGNTVQEEDGLPANDIGGEVEGVASNGEAEVGDGDEDGLVGAKDGAGGLKVAHTQPTSLALLAVGAGRDVKEQVHLPAGELVGDELEELDDGHILKQVGIEEQVGDATATAGLGALGHKGHVLLHVARESVVAVVRELPAKVGDQQRRVRRPTHNVVDSLVE